MSLFMHVPLILTDFLDRAVKFFSDKKAIIDDNRVFTYGELNERVQQLSHGLQSLGVEKGDRVAYLAPNTVEMLEGFYGVFQLGAIMVPLNIRLTPDDYLYILNHSESKVLFVDQELYHLIQPIQHELTTIKHVIVHYAEKVESAYQCYDQWLTQFPKTAFPRVEIQETDLCSLLYTSGTTGNPKGVMLTHRNNYLHAMSTMHHLRVSDKDTLLHILPMFHVNGWGSPFYYTANGATQVMLRKALPDIILEKVTKHGVTIMHMAPTVLNSILTKYHQINPNIEQSVRVVIAGSAPPPAFVTKVEQELNWEFIQVYGMTESSPLSLISMIRDHHKLSLEEQHRSKAKAGIDMIGSKVRVVDDEGNDVPQDGQTMGEIIVQSHGVMEGYWKNSEATAETICNGWLHTGDMGVVDAKGNIDICDRKKDIIISGGENISSIEVEGVFYEHPEILECAIIAVPHEKWGETPHAVIVLKPGSKLTEQECIQFARERLAHFKCPTSITFLNELPKTGSGKIQKVHLRNQFWGDKVKKVN